MSNDTKINHRKIKKREGTMTITNFTENPICRKCGSNLHILLKYKPVSAKYCSDKNTFYEGPEHLEITCGNCGFKWKMETWDKGGTK